VNLSSSCGLTRDDKAVVPNPRNPACACQVPEVHVRALTSSRSQQQDQHVTRTSFLTLIVKLCRMVVRPYFTPDKAVLPFDKLIELETIDAVTFRSVVKAYSPTGGENGTYGGHVFAQAAWAAAQTVAEGLLIHVCSSYAITVTYADIH
jgi:hypothetical protein